MNNALKLALIAGFIAIGIDGCTGKQSTSPATPAAVDSAPALTNSTKDPDARRSALIAAAEPFEALTEQAATAPPPALDNLIKDANSAVESISTNLDKGAREKLLSQLSAIAAARTSGDRTAIALTSVEGYRTLVEDAADTGKTPRAVSLMDYAGFRFQANLQATPARWSDAGAAVDFADVQWAAIVPMVADAPLRNQMTHAIADMRKAVQARDLTLARSSSTTELDLVDKLEAYFEVK